MAKKGERFVRKSRRTQAVSEELQQAEGAGEASDEAVASLTIKDNSGSGGGQGGFFSSSSTWKALGLWVLVVAVFLVLAPSRLRRRSGPKEERKSA